MVCCPSRGLFLAAFSRDMQGHRHKSQTRVLCRSPSPPVVSTTPENNAIGSPKQNSTHKLGTPCSVKKKILHKESGHPGKLPPNNFHIFGVEKKHGRRCSCGQGRILHQTSRHTKATTETRGQEGPEENHGRLRGPGRSRRSVVSVCSILLLMLTGLPLRSSVSLVRRPDMHDFCCAPATYDLGRWLRSHPSSSAVAAVCRALPSKHSNFASLALSIAPMIPIPVPCSIRVFVTWFFLYTF